MGIRKILLDAVTDELIIDPDLSNMSHPEKDALIVTLSTRLEAALKLISELQPRIDDLTRRGKTPDNSGVPPSNGQNPNRKDKASRQGPRLGSIGRNGGGPELTAVPDVGPRVGAGWCRP